MQCPARYETGCDGTHYRCCVKDRGHSPPHADGYGGDWNEKREVENDPELESEFAVQEARRIAIEDCVRRLNDLAALAQADEPRKAAILRTAARAISHC